MNRRNLSILLLELQKAGCYPCVAYRGDGTWRVHINAGGNYWADAQMPFDAALDAHRLWEQAGRPKDGLAAT